MRITTWPNGLGHDVTDGRLTFELWNNPSGIYARRVSANAGIAWRKCDAATIDAAALEAVHMWRNHRADWNPCN